MAFCTECGTELNENGVCPKCTSEKKSDDSEKKSGASEKVNEVVDKVVDEFKNAEDNTDEFDKEDVEDNIFFAVIAYFGILFIVPLIAAPNSKFAKFHAAQGLNLFILEIVYSIVSGVIVGICSHFGFIVSLLASGIMGLAGLFVFILFIQGIVNAATHKARKLPFIGEFELIKVD